MVVRLAKGVEVVMAPVKAALVRVPVEAAGQVVEMVPGVTAMVVAGVVVTQVVILEDAMVAALPVAEMVVVMAPVGVDKGAGAAVEVVERVVAAMVALMAVARVVTMAEELMAAAQVAEMVTVTMAAETVTVMAPGMPAAVMAVVD